MGRYFFDGNGNIVGLGTNGLNTTIGTYTVKTDCSATLKLNSGQSFFAVLANGGARILFIESDASAPGIVGELDLAENACVTTGGAPQNFAFSFFGSTANTTTTGTGNGTGTGRHWDGRPELALAPEQALAQPLPRRSLRSAIGSLNLDGQGGFTIREWATGTGNVQLVTASGTYTITQDCSIRLTFATRQPEPPTSRRPSVASSSTTTPASSPSSRSLPATP